MIRISAAALGLLALAACGDQRPAHYGGMTEIGLNLVSNRTDCRIDDIRISEMRSTGVFSSAWTATCAPTGVQHDCAMEGGVMQCLPK